MNIIQKSLFVYNNLLIPVHSYFIFYPRITSLFSRTVGSYIYIGYRAMVFESYTRKAQQRLQLYRQFAAAYFMHEQVFYIEYTQKLRPITRVPVQKA